MSKTKPTAGPWTLGDENNACCEVLLGTEHNLTCNFDRRDNNTCAEVISREEMLANAFLVIDAGTVFHTTGLTPSQLVERVKELEQTLSTIDGRLRQCFDDPITAREAYDSFYQEMVAAALSKARTNTAEGE